MKGASQWLRITPNLTQCLNDWGVIIKHMEKTYYSGPPVVEQADKLHQILRYLWNRHGGSLYIRPKQNRPYHLARRKSIEGKVTLQCRYPYHQLYRDGRAGSQLAGARVPHIQTGKYPRSPIM